MSISSLYASELLGGPAPNLSAELPQTVSPAASTDSTSGATSSFSSLSQVFSQLQQLATSNPTEFKTVAAQLSTQLQAQAQSSTGSDAQFYAALANNFQNAAQTGDASGLSVPAPVSSGTYTVSGKMIANNSIATMLLDGQSGANATSNLLATLGTNLGGGAAAQSGTSATTTFENMVSQDLS